MTAEQIERLQKLISDLDVVSYDQVINIDGSNDTTMLDLIVDDTAPSPEELAVKEYEKQQLWKYVEMLSPREQVILKLRMGYNSYPQTLEEVGEQFGVTRERIRQIEKKALAKLKNIMIKHGWQS